MTQLYEESISVDQNVIGLILGKGRSNLKIIEENYNVDISLNKEGSFSYLFVKAGSNLNLTMAIKDLNYLIYDKNEFYKAQQAKKKRYEEKYMESRLRIKENELRKRYILGSIDNDIPKKEINIEKGLKRNPFSVLQMFDSDESNEETELENHDQEIEYDIIDQSAIHSDISSDSPINSPTSRAIQEEFGCDYESDSDSIICQKCIDAGQTKCPCN
jgi:hypothetical protein